MTKLSATFKLFAFGPICAPLWMYSAALNSTSAPIADEKKSHYSFNISNRLPSLPGLSIHSDLPSRRNAETRAAASNPTEEVIWTTEEMLADPLSRIDKEFKVSPRLMKRTAFWFDIYTKYGSNHHVIHHLRYPWIVFKVVDTTEIIESGKGPLWKRRQRAEDLAKSERLKVRRTLQRLAKRKSFKNLTKDEREIFEKLSELKGKRTTVVRMASQNVRSQLGQKEFFKSGIKNSTAYLPYMEEIFAGENLPLGLVRLPLVESSFNVKAESKVGASGIWQIMPKTGQAYMIVNDHIDERNSPLKATKLAAKLLKQYHKALGSWPLAITAYNHGIGNIRKSMRGAKSDNLEDIIERYHQGAFKFASSNFFTCFLAALYAERYHDRLFQELEKQPLLARESVSLPNRMSLKRISQLTGLDTPTLVAYNLDLRSKKTTHKVLPRGYVLHLPPGHREKIQSRVGLEQKKPIPRS